MPTPHDTPALLLSSSLSNILLLCRGLYDELYERPYDKALSSDTPALGLHDPGVLAELVVRCAGGFSMVKRGLVTFCSSK